jgi:hypothetical protein
MKAFLYIGDDKVGEVDFKVIEEKGLTRFFEYLKDFDKSTKN